MSRALALYVTVLFLLIASPSSGAEECTDWFSKISSLPGVQLSTKALGLAVGSSNDVLITVMHGAGLIPSALGPWLPLSNEIANVARTVTGKEWIYSGMMKQSADGVALGAIIGHSLSATMNHGPLTGSLTFAANMGLTYWFPNKYLHTIMHGLPELIPDSKPGLKKIARGPVGQGVIGLSMIVIIEQLLEKSESMAEKAPHMFEPKQKKKDLEDDTRKATAAFLFDGIFQPATTKELHDQLLQYALGITREEGLLSFSAKATSPPKLSQQAKSQISKLVKTDLKKACGNLLTEPEIASIRDRLNRLADPGPSPGP